MRVIIRVTENKQKKLHVSKQLFFKLMSWTVAELVLFVGAALRYC